MVNGVVYIGSDDSNLYALNASTGAKLWSYATGAAVQSSPAVANGVVYFGSDDGNVYALNASTGAKLWSYFTTKGSECGILARRGEWGCLCRPCDLGRCGRLCVCAERQHRRAAVELAYRGGGFRRRAFLARGGEWGSLCRHYGHSICMR